ncbi:MAG: hypothetical protein D6823_11620 [Chloroflexi bacterium]|jgi:hypothetical protein|nr:MAG: hypothetical protein D6823_11620 [Chloroflexota bacterium]
MSNGTQLNLDRLAAKHAQQIIDRTKDKPSSAVDNTITKALGVLQEDGVYACFLYLLAREKENGPVVVDEMLNLLDQLGFGWGKPADNSPEKVLAHITEKVTVNLERLLLVKETLEQMLIYARYGAKARS